MILFRYSDTEIKQLLDSLVVIVDTREQKCTHITDYLKSKGVEYKSMKLDHGDYTAMIPKSEKLGLMRDLYFNDVISIERKRNLNELSGNFTKDRARFEAEFIRSKGKMILLVENSSYEDLIQGRYTTQFNSKSFLASLKAFESRYNFTTAFIEDSKYTGNYIYHTLYYEIREYLKGNKKVA